MTTIPLSGLVAGANINARTTNKMEGIESLAASIRAKGIIEPLAVREKDDMTAEIIDGNRRYAALCKLLKDGDITADYAVPVHYRPQDADDFDARESSLVANIERVPLHPIDQFEEFSRLSERYSPEEIAARYGITERLVRQRVALGGLHPKIREAWRANELRDEAAYAFTLATDQKRQLKAFEKLAKQHNLWSGNIKAELGVNHDAAKALKIIGADAYRAAGGHFVEDLFGDDCVVSDPALAQQLLADRLQAECDALIAGGWSFAVLKESIKEPWRWPRVKPTGKATATDEESARLNELDQQISALNESGESDDGLSEADEARLEELEAEKERINAAIDLRRWGAKQKKTAGCFVDVSYRGEIEITYGVQNPKDAKQAAKEKASKAGVDESASGEEKPAISNSLALALSEQLTIAASKALAADPCLALRVATAALECTLGCNVVKLHPNGLPALRAETDMAATFENVLDDLLKASEEDALARFAAAFVPALDFRAIHQFGQQQQPSGLGELLRPIDDETFLREARAVFDADSYFKSVNAALCNAALDEMDIVGNRPKKKADLAALCADAAREHGWLPPQMRKPEAEQLDSAE